MSSLQYYNDAVGEKNKKEFGYSQAVVLGDIVKCSGQGGWDENGKIDNDQLNQVELAFKSVDRVLQKVGLRGWEDVYSVRSYHIDIDGTLDKVVEMFKKRLGHTPLWTCVEVTKLGDPAMKIEIEVEAYKGK